MSNFKGETSQMVERKNTYQAEREGYPRAGGPNAQTRNSLIGGDRYRQIQVHL